MSSKKSKSRIQQSSSDSDSGPEDRHPPQKKVKVDKKSASSSGNAETSMFQLSKMRYVSVREFRGKVMVDIREYYDSNGDLKPGKKGICLSLDQWNSLKEHIDSIDDAIKMF
ncbi:activated RNA polymerase II transcriptional coactivator p15 isoform X2 [Centruroides vittatus]|nr:activated RNA polymerase II transcriptional coactivator p15-like [Centruroides sculpturatus]XP_023231489.1 activated RNA polymerase II transcriptional coactivator p15-like [Centruroides sculpturatus]XP_023231490.1 activated RNA polymerase II transcriptional coactivator p15-like [Centruroides sculpturatus]